MAHFLKRLTDGKDQKIFLWSAEIDPQSLQSSRSVKTISFLFLGGGLRQSFILHRAKALKKSFLYSFSIKIPNIRRSKL